MREMWKIVGIVVFSIAFGMVLTVLISNRLASLIVAIILLLVSYNIIFCERYAQKKTVCKFSVNSGSLIFVSNFAAEAKRRDTSPIILFLLCRTSDSWYIHVISWMRR